MSNNPIDARDPISKLSRNDRVVGPARLAVDEGVTPLALSRTLAAGLRYNQPSDPAAQKIQTMIREAGLDTVLQEVCGIEPASELARMVKQAYAELKKTT